MKKEKIAVIGGGAAGVMAVLRGILNNDEVLFFPGSGKNKKRSRAFWVKKVENIPGYFGYKKGIDDPNKETLKWIEESEFAHNFELKKNRGITSIKKEDNLFHLEDDKGDEYEADYVVLCTGLMDVQPRIGGVIDDIFPYANHQSIDYCIRCDGHHIYKKETSIIGHTNGAAWVAIMLYERYKPPGMTILTNGEKADFNEDTLKLLEKYSIKIEESEIFQVIGQPKEGKLEGFTLCCGKSIDSEITFVSLGMIIYNELAKQLNADLDERGFVLTDEKGETNISNLFVAGDLRANAKKQIYTAWDHAVDSLDKINLRIRTNRRNS